MATEEKTDTKISLLSMQALVQELRGIAFHIENTDAPYYGNSGCENGKDKLLDDGGATQTRDVKTLRKIADLFKQFFHTDSDSVVSGSVSLRSATQP